MDYSYPLLAKVFNHYKTSEIVGDIYLVCCQHLLEPQLVMFKKFIEFGFSPEMIIILGKAYSTNLEIAEELKKLGVYVVQPVFNGNSFDEEHKKNCETILDLTPSDSKVIVLDDGGELIKTFANANRNVSFAVEQTSSGFRKLESERFNFPVINVARSATKLVQESPLIARHCFERVKEYLETKNVINPKVLVVGLGYIGEAIKQIFEQKGFVVNGYDTKHGHSDLTAVITDTSSNVIIGASGSPVLEKGDIEKLVSNTPIYFMSVSSSDREFPVISFRKTKEVHADVMYENITFVNNGFPVTFKGNRNELTPIEIEKTICLLAGSVLDAVVNGVQGNGLIGVTQELEMQIN